MAKKQDANVQSPAIEQNADAQKPDVKNVGVVVDLPTKPQANDSGNDAPATTATKPAKDGTVDGMIEQIRGAFKGMATVDHALEMKTAIAADLFMPLTTQEQVKELTRHAIYGYIHGRAGKMEAEKFFAMKKQSEHELYKVAANAVKRAKDRAVKNGWVNPKEPTDRAPRDKKAPGEGSELLSALNTLINTDPEFTTALAYAVANPAMFKAWAASSAQAASKATVRRAA